MRDTTYNGWTNYETWLVSLWMENEQCSQEYFREQAREIYDGHEPIPDTRLTREEVVRFRFADWLKEHYDENIPEIPGVYGDLLGAALSSVNWDEIAHHYIEAIKEEANA
ncbi:MAG: hypothetical protein EBT15_12005 [Betaproteobacteria bacterium]|nr:hypothetical protein [Betaproteobacteria bacterium]